MAQRKRTTRPAPSPAPAQGADDGGAEPGRPAVPDAASATPTTDYTRAGGHVLTDYGWVPEAQVRR